jgi:hypothetical protein
VNLQSLAGGAKSAKDSNAQLICTCATWCIRPTEFTSEKEKLHPLEGASLFANCLVREKFAFSKMTKRKSR